MKTLDVEIVLKRNRLIEYEPQCVGKQKLQRIKPLNFSNVTKSEVSTACFIYLSKKRIKTGMIMSNFDDAQLPMLSHEVQCIIIEDDEVGVFGCNVYDL